MSAWISTKDTSKRPPDKFLAVSRWGKVSIMERRGYGDPDWLVGGYYLPKDIRYWLPFPEVPEEEVE